MNYIRTTRMQISINQIQVSTGVVHTPLAICGNNIRLDRICIVFMGDQMIRLCIARARKYVDLLSGSWLSLFKAETHGLLDESRAFGSYLRC
jgi:hypothetical protein